MSHAALLSQFTCLLIILSALLMQNEEMAVNAEGKFGEGCLRGSRGKGFNGSEGQLNTVVVGAVGFYRECSTDVAQRELC
jgi:hypothetical protein